MSAELEKLIQETLGDLEALSRDTVPQLIQEALKAFMALSQKSRSNDPKEREEAYKTAMSLKATLETQAEDLIRSSGIEPEAFKALAENEEIFHADTWRELKSAKEEIAAFHHQVRLKPKKNTSTSKKNKANRITV